VQGPAPCRECRVRLRVRRRESTHEELKAAHATRLRFYKDKELNVTVELTQTPEHNEHQLDVVAKILDARYNEQEMLHELLVAWSGFLIRETT
jgi:hypothetical protein